jgi:hypothetical protein
VDTSQKHLFQRETHGIEALPSTLGSSPKRKLPSEKIQLNKKLKKEINF